MVFHVFQGQLHQLEKEVLLFRRHAVEQAAAGLDAVLQEDGPHFPALLREGDHLVPPVGGGLPGGHHSFPLHALDNAPGGLVGDAEVVLEVVDHRILMGEKKEQTVRLLGGQAQGLDVEVAVFDDLIGHAQNEPGRIHPIIQWATTVVNVPGLDGPKGTLA